MSSKKQEQPKAKRQQASPVESDAREKLLDEREDARTELAAMTARAVKAEQENDQLRARVASLVAQADRERRRQ